MSRHLLNLLRGFRWGYLLLVILLGLCVGGFAEINEATALLHLVINEIEINPAGFDTGNEWVELYNPTDEAIDLQDWQISYTYRGPEAQVIATESTLIKPGEYFVYTYSGLRLTNATPGIVRLIDPEGTVIDQTSPFKDEDNDEKTWQRFPDGGDPLWPDLWLFIPATQGRSNS